MKKNVLVIDGQGGMLVFTRRDKNHRKNHKRREQKSD